MDEALDLDRIAALIRGVAPDLVALQEVDSVTGRTSGVDQAVELGRLTELQSVFGRFMPYRASCSTRQSRRRTGRSRGRRS